MKNINSKFSRNDPFQKMVLKTENSYHFLLPNSSTFFISCSTWKKKIDQTKRQKQVTKTSIRTNIRSFDEVWFGRFLAESRETFPFRRRKIKTNSKFSLFVLFSSRVLYVLGNQTGAMKFGRKVLTFDEAGWENWRRFHEGACEREGPLPL